MAKQSGLGARLLVGGFDLSGDIQALDQVSGGPAPIDVTDITQSGHNRIGGLRDGHLAFTCFMDAANAHPVLAALPRTDTLMSFLVPPLAIGSPAANLNAKQVNYDPTRSAAGDLTMKVQGEGNAFGLEWGVQLTPGLRTDTAATNGAALDGAPGFSTPAVPGNGVPQTNTFPLNCTVVVTGGTGTNVAINGVLQGTFDGTYQVPSGGTITLTYTVAPTWTWTPQTLSGAQGYEQVTSFAGTSVTVSAQTSPDNSTWNPLLAFTAVAAAPAFQRVATFSGLFTATNASPCVFTSAGHTYVANQPVVLTGASVPTGFTAGNTYYVTAPSGNTFELSATPGGGAINSSSTGSGSVNAVVQRYLRAVTAGTFNPATFAVLLNRNVVAAAF